MKKYKNINLIIKEGDKTVLYMPHIGEMTGEPKSQEKPPFDFSNINCEKILKDTQILVVKFVL